MIPEIETIPESPQEKPETPTFAVILFKHTPSAPAIEGPVSVWIKENRPLMLEFMSYVGKIDNALGLAANQVAWRGNRIMKRFFAHRTGNASEYPFKMIVDPVIVERHGERVAEIEGCLIWPGRRISALRNLKLTVSYWTLDGEHIENEELDRYTSQVWQHEMDHLDGIEEKVLETGKPYVRIEEKVGRNDPCPCGSKDKNGKPIKFKKCCS